MIVEFVLDIFVIGLTLMSLYATWKLINDDLWGESMNKVLCVSDYDWDYLITIGSEYQVVDDYKDVVGVLIHDSVIYMPKYLFKKIDW